jgi:peptide deformylase
VILPIRLYGDPILRTKARAVTDFSDIPELAANMLETMYEARGVGLAGPQVGLSKRIFVWAEFDDEEEEGEEATSRIIAEHVIVNPVLETLDAQSVEGLEGCLSIPGIYEEGVPRVRALRLRYQNEHGEAQSMELEDFNARVVQHEFDHLEAKLFLDYLPVEVTQAHRAELVKMQMSAKEFLKEQREAKKGKKK